MSAAGDCPCDRIVFDSGLVRVGAFRCESGHPSFRDSGPSRNFCFVFPRTAVEIQHEHEPAFIANPNVVTFYNKGQAYQRSPIGGEGDRCDWFGVAMDVVRDVVRTFDPVPDARPEAPFRVTHSWSDAHTYLVQRQVFERAAITSAAEPLVLEEAVLALLERVVRSAYRAAPQPRRATTVRDRDAIRHVELMLSQPRRERLTLREIGGEVGISVYQLCRKFRRVNGTTLHQYRQKLHIRRSLEVVAETRLPLVDIALDAGFSSHSHFTSTFRREFALTPSSLRARRAIF